MMGKEKTELTAQDLAPFIRCEVLYHNSQKWDEAKVFILRGVIDRSENGILLEVTDKLSVMGVKYTTVHYIKPILRPLSDMTDAEVIIAHDMRLEWRDKDGVSFLHNDMMRDSRQTTWLIRQGFDVFGWIDSGLAIDKTKIS